MVIKPAIFGGMDAHHIPGVEIFVRDEGWRAGVDLPPRTVPGRCGVRDHPFSAEGYGIRMFERAFGAATDLKYILPPRQAPEQSIAGFHNFADGAGERRLVESRGAG